MENEKNYFETLNSINVSDKTEKKNGLTYLSWAWAWVEVKKLYPDTTYKVYENQANGMPYFTDGMTAMVKVSVTIKGIEHIEWLPIMDNRNKSIQLSSITSFEVNKSIQRALTKAIARHGLGLYIYAGEDIPEDAPKEAKQEKMPSQDQLAKFVQKISEKGYDERKFIATFGKSYNEMSVAELVTTYSKLK